MSTTKTRAHLRESLGVTLPKSGLEPCRMLELVQPRSPRGGRSGSQIARSSSPRLAILLQHQLTQSPTDPSVPHSMMPVEIINTVSGIEATLDSDTLDPAVPGARENFAIDRLCKIDGRCSFLHSAYPHPPARNEKPEPESDIYRCEAGPACTSVFCALEFVSRHMLQSHGIYSGAVLCLTQQGVAVEHL